MRPRLTILAVLVTLPVLLAAGRCPSSECGKLVADAQAAVNGACAKGMDPQSTACLAATAALVAARAQCPAPPVTTTTTTTTVPTVPPAVEPPPGSCPVPPDTCTTKEADLQAWEIQRPSRLRVLMDKVRQEIGDRRGNLDFPGTRLEAARALWKRGMCAIVGQEAIFVLADDGLWEEWHVAAETDGGWPQEAYRGVHHVRADAQPMPTDLSPLPDRRALHVVGHPYPGGWIDFTPIIRPQNGVTPEETQKLCEAYGFGRWADGRPRFNCPLGPDLQPKRLAREEWAMGGGTVCFTQPENTPAFHRDGNYLQCGCGAGCTALRLCSVDLTVCSDWIEIPRPTPGDGSNHL